MQPAEQEVDVETALVRLIDDDRVVLLEQFVTVNLVEQDAVGHDPHAGVGRDLVGKAHLVAHEVTELASELFGDTLGDGPCCDTAGLRVRDALCAELQRDLRELGRLARARFTRDNHDLMV